MKETKTGAWIAGTVVVSLLLGVAGWFLLISPAFAAAAETQEQAEAQMSQNDLTRSRISQLKAQFEQIDALTAELAALRQQVPTDAQLAEYRRFIAATAATHGVSVVALQTALPTALQAPVDEAAAAAEAAPAEAEAETPAAPAQPVAPTDVLYTIPVTIDVVGAYANVLAFLQDVQQAQPRLIAIESLTGTSQQQAEASAGKPATQLGDLGLVISGYLFALPDRVTQQPTEPTTGEAPAPAPLPVPDPAKNPLVPLG